MWLLLVSSVLSTLGSVSLLLPHNHCASSAFLRPPPVVRRPAQAFALFSRKETGTSSSAEAAADHAPAATASNNTDSPKGGITDWVVEGLESGNSTITSSSAIQVGENDTLPESGLPIARFRILASGMQCDDDADDLMPIRLLLARNGWGSGTHPTSRLCLEWIGDTLQGGETVLDYGCGSGILSIAALHMGAAKCVGVDVEAEALVTAVRNVELNGYGEERFEPLHTREVLPYGITTTGGVDVCVANILVGQLVRPSMVAALVSNIRPGGLLCLSGIRPGNQVESLRLAYGDYMEWMDDQYAVLAASETQQSIESYGFDCGAWSRLVGRKKTSSREDDIASMSELAVS